jgi:predicted MPP superfamily phosphohydrolase
VIFSRTRLVGIHLPISVLTAVYLWHILVMPPVVIALLLRLVVKGVAWIARAMLSPRKSMDSETSPVSPSIPESLTFIATGLTRRQLLATALVAAAPPVMGLAGVSWSLATLGSFRIRKIEVTYNNLPPALEGATIAHLSDTHLGRFTTRDDVARVVEAANRLSPDVFAFTGDLIDFDLADLPDGIDLLQRLQPRSSVIVCEGNHDLFQNRFEFERQVTNSGISLLMNESRTLMVRGYPMQFLGMKWGSPETGREPLVPEMADLTLARRRSDAFTVLLAHHPHAFDPAAEAGINLTLAGHTHGGQVMLTPNLGPGPMMYKYWSGLYRKRDAACIVSNGIGNWFPLRVNAPAEIVHVTLRGMRNS